MNKSDDDEHNIFTKEKLHKICSKFEHITTVKNGYGFEQNLDLHHDICVGVQQNSFIWKAMGFRGWWEWPPLCKSSQSALCTSSTQLAASASWSGLLGSISQLDSWFWMHTNGMKKKMNVCQLDLPSSPPVMEKSRSRMVHFWIRWALELDFLLTALMPSWMAAWTARSLPPAISDTRVALLPSLRQNSTASGVSSSSGSPESGFTLHCGGTNSNAQN